MLEELFFDLGLFVGVLQVVRTESLAVVLLGVESSAGFPLRDCIFLCLLSDAAHRTHCVVPLPRVSEHCLPVRLLID